MVVSSNLAIVNLFLKSLPIYLNLFFQQSLNIEKFCTHHFLYFVLFYKCYKLTYSTVLLNNCIKLTKPAAMTYSSVSCKFQVTSTLDKILLAESQTDSTLRNRFFDFTYFYHRYYKINSKLIVNLNFTKLSLQITNFKTFLINLFFYNFSLLLVGDKNFKHEINAFNKTYSFSKKVRSFYNTIFFNDVAYSSALDAFLMKLAKNKKIVFIILKEKSNLLVYLLKWNLFNCGFLNYTRNLFTYNLVVPITLTGIFIKFFLFNYVYFYFQLVTKLLLTHYMQYILYFKIKIRALSTN
jgi:hypothetical protein